MSRLNNLSKGWKLVVAIIICEANGIISGLLSNSGKSPWFDSLAKPQWNPPGFVFAPVWTTLYLLMAISLWIIWKSKLAENVKMQVLKLFAAQLFLNFWWSIIFFRFHLLGFAFMEILMLWITIFATIIRFSKISRTAAWLLVPYISWVSFASILSYTIWVMNK